MKRWHIAYPNTLDGHAAAAVTRLRGEGDGHKVHLYPVYTREQLLAMGTSRQANLYERIHVARYGKQLSLPELDKAHNRQDEVVLLLGLDDDQVDDVERELLDEWGAVTNLAPAYRDAACLRAWDTWHAESPQPLIIQLLGCYGAHYGRKIPNHRTLWIEEVLPLVYALFSVPTDPGTEAGWKEWEKHFKTLANAHTRKRINEGMVILRYLVRTGHSLEQLSGERREAGEMVGAGA